MIISEQELSPEEVRDYLIKIGWTESPKDRWTRKGFGKKWKTETAYRRQTKANRETREAADKLLRHIFGKEF